ncbi:uncharacterized protein DSM5745_05476 [Aspergillus mulundensis]|uniref:Uncharacterized protein n=1 Tax=Aspergillus mulundensis TaxID=1810919 RepID=A0A3D8RXQ1_9EURO|nr:Uncharacterized protein DSM5745_05476 [Aspergillus mulundensis]RDW78624.1 Uncharacterized protein DSM5745_05476 [Aspergillus mulundensis]
MVALRRFFHAEKAPSTPVSAERTSQLQSSRGRAPSVPSSTLSENEHFQNIERQFEVLHDQLKARPVPPSQPPLSRSSSHLTNKNSRHVDLVDALFSSHRYRMQSSSTMSPITPYNEDVAERNMVPFLRREALKRSPYTRIISALYQEDVADRNMAQNTTFPTARRLTESQSYQLDDKRQRDGARGRARSRSKESQLINSISQEALYSVRKSIRDQVVADANGSDSAVEGLLRAQRSAPTLSELTPTSEDGISQHLGVPPAHKQGDSWTNRPLPDSPTLPTTISVNKRQQESSTPSPRLSSSRRPLLGPRSGSKKNILDLSINTELATRGRPKKITHKAIQPPTPTTLDTKNNPSIAEVMNSPLPVATPTSSPLPSSNKKVAEIMDMFRKAYTSTQEITPHPTFETLQDAIIREINSHEAFQRVPVPEQGPPFTPSPSQDSFESATPPKPIALKEGQRRRRKSSFIRPRRDSETRKSISTSDPSNAPRRELEVPGRRRHTDAPPPSPGFFETLIPQHHNPPPEEPVTYMDLILRSESSAEANQSRISTVSVSGGSYPSSNTTPSILYMRAQTSPTSDSPRSFTNSDSDSDIIHLPSVSSIPQVKVHGVDGNNVSYAAENTTPRNAYRLMNWPKRSSRSVNLRSSFGKNRTNSGQSVASY